MYFWFFYLLIIFIYCLLILLATMGWLGVNPRINQELYEGDIYISMLIPFRNEEDKLPELLKCIKAIQYPKPLFEVLLINDHSTDNSLDIVEKALPELTNCKVLNNNKNTNGKKESLKLGIESSKGELLIFTDSDCIFSPQRLNDFAMYYVQHKKPDLIIGLVDYVKDNKLLTGLFRLEFLSLVLSGAGMAGRGTPVFCNGANLGVKRDVFDEDLDVKNELASGDDVFLLHALKKRRKRIKLLKTRESLVYTTPPKGLKQFFLQRRRWGAKSTQYDDKETVILALVVFVSNSLIPIGLAISFFSNEFYLFLLGIEAKLSIDILMLISGARFFNLGFGILMVPVIELFYPFYICFTGIAGIIKKPFQWKGRISKS